MSRAYWGAALGVVLFGTHAFAQVSAPYMLSTGPARVGMSMGVATWPDDGPDLASVLEIADATLYTAKRTGKGRVLRAGATLQTG